MAGLHGISPSSQIVAPRVIAMRGWMLLIVVVSTPMVSGCGVLSKSDATTSSWLERVQRQLAQTARDVQADLDFHENEGLEAFDPKAVQQVKAMRGEMNGATDITH